MRPSVTPKKRPKTAKKIITEEDTSEREAVPLKVLMVEGDERLRFSGRELRPGDKNWGCWVEDTIPAPLVAVRPTKDQIIKARKREIVPPNIVGSGGTGDYWIRRFRYEEKLIVYKPKGKPIHKEVEEKPLAVTEFIEELADMEELGEVVRSKAAISGDLAEVATEIKQDEERYLAKVERSAVIEGETVTDFVCIHYWLIESPKVPTSIGICKRCRAIKEFSNSFETAYARAKRRVTIGVDKSKGGNNERTLSQTRQG